MSVNITGSDKGLLSVRCQAISWNNADLMSIVHLEKSLCEIWIKM